MPLCPYFPHENGAPISVAPDRRPVVTPTVAGVEPWCFVSIGLGSKVSTCDGPPFMNRKMTRFALGAKCGAFGARGLAALASEARTPARPRAPKPPPIRRSQSRRVRPAREFEFVMAKPFGAP